MLYDQVAFSDHKKIVLEQLIKNCKKNLKLIKTMIYNPKISKKIKYSIDREEKKTITKELLVDGVFFLKKL